MDIVLRLLNGFWTFFQFLLIPLVAFIVIVFCIVLVWFTVFSCRGHRLIKGEHIRVARDNLIKNIFVNFPRRYCEDLFQRDPEFFRHQGCIIFTGRQGTGKTISMIEQAAMWQQEYPKSKCITNLAYSKENARLKKWEQLIDYKNGIHGVICCIDEMQNWFSSNQSKNFPPEMLEVITQNRKNRRVIMGTAQSFNRLAKPIREQATEVRKCCTLFGCFTIVHSVIPELDSNGDVIKWNHRGFYYFIHDDELRNSYDTYKVIESLRASGFKESKPDTQIRNYNIVKK